MKQKNTILLSLIAVLFILQSCTPKKIASDLTAQIMAGGAPSFEMEADIDLAEDSAPTMLKMLEAFSYDNPSNKTLNTLLSRSYANYAQGFLEYYMLINQDVNPVEYEKYNTRAKRFYAKGKEYGLKSLSTHGGFKTALTKDLTTFEKSLKSFGRSSVPDLFWAAMNWGSLINLTKDSPLAIAEYPKAEAIMRRALELDPNYFYAGPHLFFGFSYGTRPKMFGGDPVKSKDHFEKAVNAYGRKFLLGIVFYAQGYCVQNQDKALFESLLNEVVSADASKLPEARLANEIAKKKARWLLDNEAKFFSP